jgi:transcriptional regulator with XRE-family HTH domain
VISEYFLDLFQIKGEMKVHEKVKFFREAKRLSQESIAFNLGLNQSQYSRRENGSIKFNADEIAKLSSLLEVSTNELFGEDTIIFNNNDQKGGNFGQYINLPQELLNQYEKRIAEKDEIISLLKDKISLLEKLVKKLI